MFYCIKLREILDIKNTERRGQDIGVKALSQIIDNCKVMAGVWLTGGAGVQSPHWKSKWFNSSDQVFSVQWEFHHIQNENHK